MKQICLRDKKQIIDYTKVDDEDFERLNKRRWYRDLDGYAHSVDYIIGKKKWIHISMATEIMKQYNMYDNNKIVDHINRNKLDNRKCNLRMVTKSQSQQNKDKYRNNTSGYKGVYFDKNNSVRPWSSCITSNSKYIYLGRFFTKEEAAKAYNVAAKKYHGEFAVYNKIAD